MTFTVILSPRAKKALFALDREDYLRCTAALNLLGINPYPGFGGDKEELKGYKNRYRLHIGRTYTAIYETYPDDQLVIVALFGTIGDMHKRY